ncbi:MAG: hypothetical protein PUG76_05380 [Prevotellaceae bacterium]|nr:hypothetical protein [Prevotellaceae bacterium]
MKKITSVFTLALLLAGAVPATSFADVKPRFTIVSDPHVVVDTERPLIREAGQITSPFTETQEGNIEGMLDNDPATFWHSKWSGGNVAAGTHYFQVHLTENIENVAFKFTRRNVVGDHITQWGVYGTNNPDASKEDCIRLATIETPLGSSTETLTSKVFTTDGTQYLRFYCEETAATTTNGGKGRGYFHVADFQLYGTKMISDAEVAKLERQAALNATLAIHTQYLAYSGTFTTGTEPGLYNAEAVAAFEAALEAASVIDGPEGENLTTEQLKKIGQDIKDTYDAVIKSKVPYAVAVNDGYYFINSVVKFTETTEQTENPETGEIIPGETIQVVKGLYSNKTTTGIAARWKTTERIAPFLWKVTTKGEKKYELLNMGTDAKLTQITTSEPVAMSVTSDSLVVFDYNTVVDGTTYYNIRLASGPERGYQYVHVGGHGGGTGKEGNIVGWEQTAGSGASEWILVPVSNEEAQAIIDEYAPIKNEAERLINTKKMLNDLEPKLPKALDNSVNLERERPLIASADKITSPFTQVDEGSIPEMLDKNPATYWHSSWAGGAVPAGTHYFQVELTEQNIPSMAFEFTRRNVINDHVTKWGVYGTNEAEAEKSACTKLAEISTPFGNGTETLVSDVFKNENGLKYLRFYAEATVANRGYFHVSEFQLYPAQVIVNTTSQAVNMGSVYTNAVNAFNKAKAEGDQITVDTYTELKNAYDAFIARFVNPDTLRNKIAEKEAEVKMVVTGTNPGQWSDANAAGSLNQAITAAKAYDKAGAYTLAQSQEHVKGLDAQAEDVLAKANKIQEGKWYRIRFASEELYNANEWSKTGAEATVVEATGVTTFPALFNKLVAVSNDVVEGEGDAATHHTELAVIDDVTMGQGLHFIDENEVLNHEDAALFRFIAIGDTAYIIQNKATNMFLGLNGRAATLGVTPISWHTKAMGFGKVNIFRNTPTAINNNLHAQKANATLVTWETTTVQSNTGFMIEEAEEVTNYEGTEFNISVAPNAYATYCLPMAITAPQDEYLYGVEIEGTEVSLTRLENNTAEAGQPFIYIDGTPASYDANAENKPMTFKHGYEVVSEPKTVGKHVGVFASKSVEAGNVLIGRKAMTVAAMTSNVPAYSSYIEAALAAEDQINVTVKEDIFNSIQETVAKAVKGGDIYTIDGKYVGKGNLKSKLNKGIYIINGVKVIVK